MDIKINTYEDKMDNIETLPKRSSRRIFGIVVLIIGVITIVAALGWAFYQIDQLEKLTVSQQIQISNLQTTLSDTNSDVNDHARIISAINLDISNLSSGINYATSLAENANTWAHSHYP